MEKVGPIAFIVGLVIAIAAGFGIVDQPWMGWVLALLGAIVGYMNVAGAERNNFLVAGIALAISATALNSVPYIGDALGNVMPNIMTFIGGALFIVSIMAVFGSARN